VRAKGLDLEKKKKKRKKKKEKEKRRKKKERKKERNLAQHGSNEFLGGLKLLSHIGNTKRSKGEQLHGLCPEFLVHWHRSHSRS